MTTDYGSLLAKAETDQSITRSQMTLARLGESWAKDGRNGLRFIKGLTTWLSSYTNENTRRVNSYSVLEFFEWFEANRSVNGRRGVIPLPNQVTRDDANAYAKYLRTRTVGLEEQRLQRDPSKKLELVIYGIVKATPGAKFSTIRRRLLADPAVPRSYASTEPTLQIERDDPLALDRVLACMVEAKQLTRKPSIEELRRSPPDDQHDWARVGLDFRAPPEVFSYFLDQHTDASAEERSSTVLRRVATLSAMWRHYIERGENTQVDQGELLKYNIWSDLVKHEGKIAPLQQKVHRLESTPTMDHWRKLMATAESGSIDDVRDRALMALMFFMGLRVTEMVRLKRKDRVLIEGKPFLRLLRKRSKAQLLAIPTPVLQALGALDRKMEELAVDAEARQVALAQKLGSQESMTVPRWRRLLEEPEAPLVPAVARWGCNASQSLDVQDAPLTRQAVTMMLRRRGHAAGIPEAEWDKLHPHGFRRLGARTAYESGTPMTTIQTALGHDNIATTGRYIEDRDQDRVALFPQFLIPEDKPAAAAPAAEPEAAQPVAPPMSRREQREAARARRRQVVDAPIVFEAQAEEVVEPVTVTSEPMPAIVEESVAAAPAAVSPPPMPSPPQPAISTTRVESRVAVAPPREPEVLAEAGAEEDEATGLIGLSACAPLERAGEGMPDYAYEPQCWGESHDNACGVRASKRARDRDGNPIPNDPVSRIWVGRGSRLPWWGGTSDKLRPEMPVMSLDQVVGGGNFDFDENGNQVFLPYTDGASLQQILADLWSTWASAALITPASPGEPGPSAAAALVRWVSTAISVAVDFEQYRVATKRQWLPYAQDDVLVEEPGQIFKSYRGLRQHREDYVAGWFEQFGSVYRESIAGREGRVHRLDDRPVIEAPLDPKDQGHVRVPEWYGDADPIRSMLPAERAELFDLLRVLSGQDLAASPRVYRSRLNGASVPLADVAVLLSQMCLYDSIVSQLTDRKTVKEAKAELFRQKRAVLDEIAKLLARFGWHPTGTVYDSSEKKDVPRTYDRLVEERREETRRAQRGALEGEAPQKKSRRLAYKFYLDVLGEIFGEGVSSDRVLLVLSKCNASPPLQSFAEFFAIDSKAGTIVHDPDFAAEFAINIGTHSECVARRLAREIYELSRLSDRVLDRPDELALRLGTMQAFAIPCPPLLEKQLASRLDPGSNRLDNVWRTAMSDLAEQQMGERSSSTRQDEIREYEAEVKARVAATAEGEFARSLKGRREGEGARFKPNPAAVLRMTPNPISILFALLAAR